MSECVAAMSIRSESSGVLRPMQDRDLEMVLMWRNAPEVRKNMYSQQVIALRDHRRWWAQTKDSKNSQYLIFEAGGVPSGLVNFTYINKEKNSAYWGFYTRPYAPKGTGSRLGIAALDFAFKSLGLTALEGEVLANNAASRAFHKKLGFREVSYLATHKEIDGALQGVYRFTIEAAGWAKHRTNLLQEIESRYPDAT